MSQKQAILAMLQAGHSITPWAALQRLNCMRLGARIWELKAEGHDILSTPKITKTGKRIAEYRLNIEPELPLRMPS